MTLNKEYVLAVYKGFLLFHCKLMIVDGFKCWSHTHPDYYNMNPVSKSSFTVGPFLRHYGLFTTKLRGVFR